jgi:hypothetical protein
LVGGVGFFRADRSGGKECREEPCERGVEVFAHVAGGNLAENAGKIKCRGRGRPEHG